MIANESLDRTDFDLMKEIWTVSALDGIRGSFYSKELDAAMREVRVSNAISHDCESIPVTERRIRAILDGDVPRTHNEHMVAGYDRALQMILNEHESLDFDERSMLLLHRTLMSGLLCEKGQFRTGTEAAMAILIEDYRSQNQDVLSFLPAAMKKFSSIAPFRDGNKRMRSLLTTLALIKGGYTAHIYVGLDESLPLLQGLMSSYRELDRRYPIVGNKKVKKRDRILHIIETSQSPVRKKDICACIPDVSVRTAEVVLSDLIEQNKVEKLGTFKDARYVLV